MIGKLKVRNRKPQSFIEWLRELFTDERGSTSVKPLIAVIGALFLCTTMLIEALSKIDLKISETLINAVMIITSVGMGADTVDKYSVKPPADPEPTNVGDPAL
jgi:hypothetical protein